MSDEQKNTPTSPEVGGDELLSCPFCGGTAVALDDGSHSYVLCDVCLAEGPAGALSEAVAAWNRRAVPPEEILRRVSHEISVDPAFVGVPAADVDNMLHRLRRVFVATPATDEPDHSAVHRHVLNYDGATHCFDCRSWWGVLPGNPGPPPTCVPLEVPPPPQNETNEHRLDYGHDAVTNCGHKECAGAACCQCLNHWPLRHDKRCFNACGEGAICRECVRAGAASPPQRETIVERDELRAEIERLTAEIDLHAQDRAEWIAQYNRREEQWKSAIERVAKDAAEETNP